MCSRQWHRVGEVGGGVECGGGGGCEVVGQWCGRKGGTGQVGWWGGGWWQQTPARVGIVALG